MHLYQTTKMAFKSLLTNKIRSFLTMLGIIIGVFAVSLLSTVASGVTDAIVSSIKSQSTLAAMVNMSNNLTYQKANKIIQSVKPDDETSEDNFSYSLIYSNSTLVANAEKSILQADNPGEYLTAERLYSKDDFDYTKMTDEEKSLADALIKKKKGALGTTVYAVDSNFKDVYNAKIYGTFPTKSDDILVDTVFLKTFFGSEKVTQENAIGRVITLGVLNYTKCQINFSDDTQVTDNLITTIITTLKAGVIVTIGEGENQTSQTVKFQIVKNDDGSEYRFNEETKELVINVEINKYITNEEITNHIENLISGFDAPYNKTTIKIEDVYDISKAKEYKITGVFDENENSIISSISIGDSSVNSKINNSLFMAFIQSMAGVKGSCYTLISDETVACLSKGSVYDYRNAVINFAFFRYNNENVMNAGVTSLIVSFSTHNFKYMTDFIIVSFSSVSKIISKVMNILTIMLTVISVISLIVGGIGIMNIMLVAVSERTREIGIRKAVGAKKSSILLQFLVEAVTISIFGGLIGLGLSFIGTLIISNIMSISLVMPIWVILMSVGFCTAIGVIFGMFPAIKASNMQPIDALRR